jgi:hypothetical protein
MSQAPANRIYSNEAALEQRAASAGVALACPFSSYDEYYADIIDRRRSAGAYGPPWYYAPAAIVSAATVLVVAILLVF